MAPEASQGARVGVLFALTFLCCAGCAPLRSSLPGSLWPDGLVDSLRNRPDSDALARPSDLLPPESLRVTSTEDRQISLAWNPVLVGDVAGYVITRSTSAQGPFATVGRTPSRFGTVFTDEGDGPGALGDLQTYFYRIHPLDTQGRMSRSHAFVSATTQSPPAVPDGLQVYSNLPRRVVLTWEPSEHWTVWGYAAYRSPTMAGPWEKISTVSGRLRAVYEDQVPGDLRVMYYRITAVNRYGGESELTDAVRAVTKAEPLPPVDLSIGERKLGSVELRWAPNVERDLLAYEVWRARREGDGWGEPEWLAQVPANATSFADVQVGCGETLRYSVRATDDDGLVSDFSAPLDVRALDLGLAFETRSDGGWRLTWPEERARGWSLARIVHRRALLPDKLLGEVTDADFFDLPDLGGRKARLSVLLSRTAPATDRDATDTNAAPVCEIEFAGAGTSLLNPPAASVD